MAAEILSDLSRATDSNSSPLAGAGWYFYVTETLTPLPTYTTAALTIEHEHPVVADAGGLFPAIYFDASKQYRGILRDAGGSTLRDIDPINGGVVASLSAPGGSDVVGFLQEGTGAQARTVQDKARERLSILDFCTDAQREDILSNTGSLDVSDAWQSALNVLTDNGALDLVGGTHRLESAVSVSGKDRIRIIGNGARVLEGSPSISALVTLTSCDRAHIEDIHFVGTETFTYFAANSPTSRRRFLVLSSCDRGRVENVTGEAKRGHIYLTNCSASIVDKSDFVGFFQALSSGAQANANECPSVEIAGGRNNTARDCHAENHGSCVLFMSDGIGHQAVGCSGRNLHDNGVYGSSGTRFRAYGCDFSEVFNSGVKLRGSLNIAALNSTYNAGIAVTVTGNGTTPDSYSANGRANIAALNSGDAISSDGISISIQDGYYSRNSIVALNAITNLTGAGGFAGVRGTILVGGVVALNSFANITSDYGIILAGTASLTQKSLVVIGNSFGTLTGGQQAIRIQYATESVIGENAGTAVTNLIQGRFVTNSVFSFNVNPNGSTALSLSSANSNSDNVVVGQRGGSSIDAATHVSLANYPSATLPGPTTTPKALNLITVSSGIGYISTGTSSSADWKQIT